MFPSNSDALPGCHYTEKVKTDGLRSLLLGDDPAFTRSYEPVPFVRDAELAGKLMASDFTVKGIIEAGGGRKSGENENQTFLRITGFSPELLSYVTESFPADPSRAAIEHFLENPPPETADERTFMRSIAVQRIAYCADQQRLEAVADVVRSAAAAVQRENYSTARSSLANLSSGSVSALLHKLVALAESCDWDTLRQTRDWPTLIQQEGELATLLRAYDEASYPSGPGVPDTP